MKNAADAAAKKRSINEGLAEPPSKRFRDAAAACPSWSDLTPELTGQITRFLPMGTPDMMRLLLCVGPRVAAIVRKVYLKGNEYYLWYYVAEHYASMERVKGCIGYWMDHNEEAWKNRCLGKACKENAHTVMLTPAQFRSLEFGEFNVLYADYAFSDLISVDHNTLTSLALDEASRNALVKLVKNCPEIFLIAVGDEYVDDRRFMTEEMFDSLVDSAPINSDGNICARFMCSNDALFAYPEHFLYYDLVDVLRYMIEHEIIKPRMTIASFDPDGDRDEESLVNYAMNRDSSNCFRYLLSLPGTDINAVAAKTQAGDSENIIHSCLNSNEISPNYLQDILADSNVEVDAQNASDQTAICLGCGAYPVGDHVIAKVRLLLEAGADPRIEDEDGHSPFSRLQDKVEYIESSPKYPSIESKGKLESLQREIMERVHELNNKGERHT